jgi:hypothetical protein
MVGITADIVVNQANADYATNNYSAIAPVSGNVVGQYRVHRFIGATDNGAHADLQIRYLGSRLESNGANIAVSGMMVAKTTTSQGYTNTGSLSIVVGSQSGLQSARFAFEWYTPDGTFTTSQNTVLNYTALDVDFRQFIRARSTDFTQSALSATTNLNLANNVNINDAEWTLVSETANASSAIGNPTNAAQFLGASTSTHVLEMGRASSNAGPSLFIFEFETPCTVGDLTATTPIPEPSSYVVIASFAVFGFVANRRRRV